MTPKRLIISRTDSIGDVILTLPVAGELKRQFPQLHIIFLGSSYTKPIVECCPNVDEFADWTEISRLSDADKVLAFKKMQADTILHVFPRREIARVAKKAGIPLRVGTSHRVYHWLTCNVKVNLSRKHSDLHESQLNLQLLSAFGCPNQYELDEVRERLAFYPPALHFDALDLLSTSRYNVILHPKSKGSAREWGIDHFCRLVDCLPEERFKIFICGTASEREQMGALLDKIGENVVDLCGQLSLSQYITFIANADALVAASTGPLHIAAVVGSHAVGLYPPMRPIHPGRWSPIGKDVKVFCLEKQCEACRHTMDCACMKAIKPEVVAQHLSERAARKEV